MAAKKKCSFLKDADYLRFPEEVNISYGYETGDALLVETASRLNSVQGVFAIGRLGGNDFAVCAAVDDEASGAALVDLIASRLSSAVVLADITI